MGARGALAALLLAASVFVPSSACAAGAVRVNAALDRHARLGGSSALTLGLHVDTRQEPSPVTSVRLSYAAGLGVVSSSLGLDSCVRPASEFQAILISSTGLGGCPPDAVMAYGTARAIVRLVQNGQVIPEYANLTVLSGPIEHGVLQLVLFIDGQRPFGARLILAGQAVAAPSPYGGALVVQFPQIASLEDLATIYLTDLQLTLGSPKIRYYDHGHSYWPGGIALPDRCPVHGLRFAVALNFRDGTHRAASTTTPCPRGRATR